MSEYTDLLAARVRASVEAKQQLLEGGALDVAAQIATALVTSLGAGGRALWFGNGGSSMDSGHLAAELLGRFYVDRPPLASLALADNTAAMTAIGNDYAYEEVFARQVRGLGRPGDVAIGLTTSGGSKNVVAGLSAAREAGLVTVAFTGSRGGAVADVAEHVFCAPSDDTPRVQEIHMLVGHTICELVERELFATAGA